MQLNYFQQNPFTRRQLLKSNHRLYNSNVNVSPYSKLDLDWRVGSRVQRYPLNIWNFHDNHNKQFSAWIPAKGYTEFSSFEKSMMTSQASSRRQLRNSRKGYGEVNENPFYRKNLLVNRQQLEDEVEYDLSLIGYKQYPTSYDTPATEDAKGGFIDNNSIMMKLISQNSNSKKISSKYDDEINIPINARPSDQQNQSMPLPQERMSFRKTEKEEHKSHTNQKQTIRVMGKEYHRAKVYPTSG